MKVTVVPPDSGWPAIFAEESRRVATALTVDARAVHHIGSTSIPDIWAKPVIDMLVEARDLAALDERNDAMRAIGYEPMGEFGIPGRRFFRKYGSDGVRTHHVHAFLAGSAGARRHLAFRDFMRVHPDDAREYSDLKRALAEDDPTIERYMDGKNAFVKDAEERALAWWNAKRLAEDGFLVLPNVVDTDTLARLDRHIESLRAAGQVAVAGTRNLLGSDALLAEFAISPSALGLVSRFIGPAAKPVRMILFDKTPEANWGIPWHQDGSIAVRGDARPTGYGPWSMKGGVQHAVPPNAVLESMLTLRVHLDDCSSVQGPLLVARGSHLLGRLADRDSPESWPQEQVHECLVEAGGAVLMRPLLFHSSRKATAPGRRRVVHIEYAATDLADGLEWYFAPAKIEVEDCDLNL